jgi:glucose/arabinose dehydrogenase
MAVHPLSGRLWCATTERDRLGDNLAPDFVNSIDIRGFYGWPWFYGGQFEDPRQAGERPDLVPYVLTPDVLIQAHSSPLGITFYDGSQFPVEYRNNAFVTLRGSWNRAERTGYKVVRIITDSSGGSDGWYEDFLTGFVANNEEVWGRPVGIAVARDGSLLVSEDGNGTIWRISYQP